MNWKPYTEPGGRVYDLTHVHDHNVSCTLPATIMRPTSTHDVHVTYGLHCFTKDPPPGPVDPAHIYYRNPEGRVFCPARYQITLELGGIMATLVDRNCQEADRRNHVLFSTFVSRAGPQFAVFFKLSKAGGPAPWDANLMIISCHHRNGVKGLGKPIKFRDLLRTKI